MLLAVQGRTPSGKALGRRLGLLVGRGLHVQLERLAVHRQPAVGTGGVSLLQGSLPAGGPSPWPVGASCPCRTHVFLLQVEDVVDGFLHVLRGPVTVTQLGSGAPLCGKRMSTWKESTQSLGGPGPRCACANGPLLVGVPCAVRAWCSELHAPPGPGKAARHALPSSVSSPRCEPQHLTT